MREKEKLTEKVLASFALLIRHHLVDLSRHRLDVRDDQLVQIGISVLSSDSKSLSNSEFVRFVQLVNSCRIKLSARSNGERRRDEPIC